MQSKKNLLVCMPDFPFPARKNGISIRYYPILEHAAKKFNIHLLIIAEGKVGQEAILEAKQFCEKISVHTRTPKNVSTFKKLTYRTKSLIPYTLPFDLIRYDEKDIETFIAQETKNTIYDNALCVLLSYQHLVKKVVQANRYVIDFIDSPYSTSFRKKGRSLLKAYDSFLLKLWERKTINALDYACYVSPLDRKLGAGINLNEEKIGVIPNGLYLNDFSEEKIDFGCNTIGYLGHMGYPPNIKAALRLYSIFKTHCLKLPNTKLVIIGRDPSPEITALAADKNVIITGTVENIWPYINGVDLFVFPMEIGSGQQNKLLEAMAAGIPVISTELGNSGIGATHNEEIIIANSNQEIGNSMVSLLQDNQRRQRIGITGKKFITENYYWPSILNIIDTKLLRTNHTNPNYPI